MRRTILALAATGSLVLTMIFAAPVAAADCVTDAGTGVTTCTFVYTGAVEQWTVPANVEAIALTVVGGGGGAGGCGPGGPFGGAGGRGGSLSSTAGVAPGDVLEITVAGGGGGTCDTNGNHAFGGGGSGSTFGADGGGASSVVFHATGELLTVAAGGGGAGATGLCADEECGASSGVGGAGGDVSDYSGADGVGFTIGDVTVGGGGGGSHGSLDAGLGEGGDGGTETCEVGTPGADGGDGALEPPGADSNGYGGGGGGGRFGGGAGGDGATCDLGFEVIGGGGGGGAGESGLNTFGGMFTGHGLGGTTDCGSHPLGTLACDGDPGSVTISYPVDLFPSSSPLPNTDTTNAESHFPAAALLLVAMAWVGVTLLVVPRRFRRSRS